MGICSYTAKLIVFIEILLYFSSRFSLDFFKPLIHFQNSEKLDLDNLASRYVLRWPLLAATWSRTWVPSQRLRLGGSGKTTRPLVSDGGPGPSALQRRISTKVESSELSKEFIKRKKRTVLVDRHTGRLRGRAPESRPHGSFKPFI